MASSIKLPEGFVLDAPVAKVETNGTNLPEGFVLDPPTVETDTDAPTEERGFLERLGEDIESREAILAEINRANEAGEQTLPESVLQALGKVGFGVMLDVIGEGLISGIRGLSEITPDFIEDPIVDAVSQAGNAFLETDIGKAGLEAIQKGFASYNEFASENPRAARNIEAVIDVGLMLAPIKGKPKVKAKPTFADKLATKTQAAAVAQSARQRAAFTDDLVSPKKTKKVKEEEILRSTEEGVLGTRTVEPSAFERSMADEVSKIAEVKPSNTLLGNLNVVRDASRLEAETLKAALRKNEVIFPRAEFNAELDRAIARLAKSPSIVGDAAKSAEKVVAEMRRITSELPSTGSGLLQARKDLDRFIKAQKPAVFDASKESAVSTAVREIRQTTNSFLDAKAVNVAVKESLRKQSLLFGAVDNIGPKAADEAGNAITRLFQKVARAIPIKNQTASGVITGLGMMVGAGAAVTVANVAPFMTALAIPAGALFAGGKFAASPAAKQAIASILRLTDKAIRTTKDKALIAELKADRGAVAEIFKQLDQTNE